jgi:transposase
LTTKLHAAVDGQGQPLRLIVSPGHAGDAPRAGELLSGLEPRYVIADAAYDSDAIRSDIRRHGGKPCIRPNPTRKHKKRYDRRRYQHRNVIERFFGAIKRFRRVATRYEKKAVNYLGFAWIAAILVNL